MSDYRITKFSEKPQDPEGMPGSREQFALGSMGIYVFKAQPAVPAARGAREAPGHLA